MADSLTEQDMADWTVTLPAYPGFEPVTVRAAYPTTDQNLPGWTLLKDFRHKVVLGVREDLQPVIRRAADPVPAGRVPEPGRRPASRP